MVVVLLVIFCIDAKVKVLPQNGLSINKIVVIYGLLLLLLVLVISHGYFYDYL